MPECDKPFPGTRDREVSITKPLIHRYFILERRVNK